MTGEGVMFYDIDAPMAGLAMPLVGLVVGRIVWCLEIPQTRRAPPGQRCGNPASATLSNERFGIEVRLRDNIAQMAW